MTTTNLQPVNCGCGGEAKVDWTVINGAYMAGVVCQKCGTKTAPVWRRDDLDGAKAEAITAWNLAMGAKDINVPKERTAKVECKRYIGTSTGIVGEIKVTGICENCHNAVVDRYSFCPNCGCRLEWK